MVCFVVPVYLCFVLFFFFFQAEDGIRDLTVTGVQTCALPISAQPSPPAPTGCTPASTSTARRPCGSPCSCCWGWCSSWACIRRRSGTQWRAGCRRAARSEEHTSEPQSQSNLVCRLLLEKKKTRKPDT